MRSDVTAGLGSLSLESLFDQASSTEPVPGGGCVSAVCGYFALAILLKSIRVSRRSHPQDASLNAVDQQLSAMAVQILGLAQADSDSFRAYMKALAIPKTTPEETALRKQAIHEAAIGSTVAALNILEAGNQVLDIAHSVQGRVSASILADEKSAVELISAMNSTAEWNAASNLSSLPGDTDLSQRLSEAKAKHATLLAACHAV